MDLLWITENYPPGRGGMSQSCDRIVKGVRQAGIAVHLVHLTNRRKPFYTEELINGSYTAIPVSESEGHTLNLLWNFIAGSDLNFDKLVLFGGYLPIVAGPVLAKWMNISLITLLRGNDFDAAVFTPKRYDSLFRCLHASDAIGCVTLEMIDKLGKLEATLPLFYTPNGIELGGWELMTSELNWAQKWRLEHFSDKKCVGIIGQLKAKKGIDLLIESFKGSLSLKEKIGVLLVGDLDEAFELELRDSGIEFMLIPFQDRFELLKYYGACDAIVIPSYYDGMPNVLMEAGGLGIPVMGSMVGGMKDVLQERLPDWLFKAGSAEDLRAKLLWLADMDQNFLCEAGEELKSIITNNFNDQREINMIMELILKNR